MPTNKHVANIKSNQMLEILLKAIDYKWIAQNTNTYLWPPKFMCHLAKVLL